MIEIDGHGLTCAQIAAVARGEAVQLHPSGRARAEASHAYAQQVVGTRAVYGRSTGVGANRDVVVTDPAAHGSRLLRSHATSAGPLRSGLRVRATAVVRLNQLAAGGSGVAPAALNALAQRLNRDDLPAVREYGGIGTADLAALATLGLAVQANGVDLGTDALGFISSNAATIADAALAGPELLELLEAALVVAALTFVAVSGNAESFAEVVETVTPFAGARWVCSTMRSLVAGAGPPSRIQDPFALRTLPQAHGVARDAVDDLARVIERMANSPSENPILLGEPPTVAHHGGFHATYLVAACDAAALAVAQSAQLVLGRIGLLVEPAFTGLHPFLADGPAGASGIMLIEYVAAGALATLRAAATPASLQTVTISRGAEDDASFAPLGAAQLGPVISAYRTLLAGELLAAVRALTLGGRDVPPGLADAIAACARLTGPTNDRDLSEDLAAAEQLLGSMARTARWRP